MPFGVSMADDLLDVDVSFLQFISKTEVVKEKKIILKGICVL